MSLSGNSGPAACRQWYSVMNKPKPAKASYKDLFKNPLETKRKRRRKKRS